MPELSNKHFVLILIVIFGGVGLYGTHYYFSNQKVQIEAEKEIKAATIAAEKDIESASIKAELDKERSDNHGKWINEITPWGKR